MNKSVRKSILVISVVALAIIITLKYCPRFAADHTEVELLNESGISDGPYVFVNNEQAEVKWVSNDSLFNKNIEVSDYINITGDVNYEFKVEQLQSVIQKQADNYSGVTNMVVLSDIHGQYDLFIDLLTANNIIDKHGNWNYKNGHLIIIGDAFDRGEKVTETLWHILKLADQAEDKGGKVHYLLGNHDIMVLNADLRYIHDKYRKVEKQTNYTYAQLFGPETLMGQWLRACPVVLRINDIIFNHAGISMAMVHSNQTVTGINQTFATSIIDNNRDSIRANKELSLLSRSSGPIWYRGYFRDTTLTNASIDSILHHFDANHIVVGHTSMEQVEVLFDRRILAADTSIKRGEKGELLFIEDGKFYRSGLDGKKTLLW